MIEIFIVIVGVVLVFFVEAFWMKVFIILFCMGIVLPGMYSMIYGAPSISTSKKRMDSILKLGEFSEGDIVYDLGCGNGRLIREISKKGVKNAVGYEFSIPMFFLAKVSNYLKKGKEIIKFGNFWKKDFSDADVIVCFLLDKSFKEFEKKIWPGLKRGARVLSNDFEFAKTEPDKVDGRVFMYVKK